MIDKMIIEKIKKQVPEFFKSEFGQQINDDDGIYVVMGSFAQYLRLEINTKQSINDTIERCVSLINEISNSKESDIPNLMIVGFFEVFADEPECVDYVKKQLNQNAMSYLQNAIDYWQNNSDNKNKQ